MKRIFTLFVSLTFFSWMSQAQAPTTQATNITFDPVSGTNTSLIVNWTAGLAANKVLIVVRDSTATFSPLDNTTYAATPTVNFSTAANIFQGGTGRAVSIYNATPGTATGSITVSNLSTTGHYVVQIYEYTGAALAEKYNISAAANNPMYFRMVTTTGTTSWTVPGGIKNIRGQVWGSGGGGGFGKGSSNDGGSGGAGGGYSSATFAVSSGQSHTVKVGAKGDGGIESGSVISVDGALSSIDLTGTIKVEATGGGRGLGNSTTGGGNGGTATVGTGFAGGDGANATAAQGGGGGTSGGTGAVGSSAVDGGIAAGTPVPVGAGAGSAGTTDGTAAANAFFPGGGGGGGGDANGGDGGDGGDGLVIISYQLRPKASIAYQSPLTSTTNSSPVTFRVTFSEPVTNVTIDDFINSGTGGGTIGVSGSSGTVIDVTVSGITLTNGFTVNLDFVGGKDIASSASGNLLFTLPTADPTYTIDVTAPDGSAPSPTAQRIKGGSTSSSTIQSTETGLVYLVLSTEAATTTTELNTAVAADEAFSLAVTASTPRTVPVPSVGAVGPLVDGLYKIVAVDAAGNIDQTPAAGWLTVDNTPPTPTINHSQPDPAFTSPFTFQIGFVEAVTGFINSDINLAGGTATGQTISSLSSGDGGINWTLVIASTDLDGGTIVPTIAPGAAVDLALTGGNASLAPVLTDNSITFNPKIQTTISLATAPVQNDPTNSPTINFKVVFAEAMNPADFTAVDINTSGSTATTIIVGAPNTLNNIEWNVPITLGTPVAGTVVINIAADAVANAGATNFNAAATITDNSVAFDNLAPSVVLTDPHPDAVVRDGDTNFIITATFTETNGSTGTPTITGLPTIAIGTAQSATPMTGSYPTYTFTWNVPSGNNGDQLVTISAVDNAGNANSAATAGGGGTTSYNIDNTPPTVALTDDQTDARVRNTETVNFTATFTEVNATTSNGVVGTPTIAIGTALTATPMIGGPLVWTYAWVVPTGDHINQSVTITGLTDIAGNPNAGVTGTRIIFTVDNTAPTATITRKTPSTLFTNATTVLFDVTFNEPVVTGAAVDFLKTGTAAGTLGTVTPNTTQQYDVQIASVSGNGNINLDIAGTQDFTDVAGNPFVGTITGTEQEYTIDNIAPTVEITDNHPDAIVLDADLVLITATFVEANQPLLAAPTIAIGTALSAIAMNATGNPLIWTFSWNVPSGNFLNQAVTIIANDRAGNPNTAATADVNGTLFYTVDNTAPTVAITRLVPATPTTTGTSITFRVTFDEEVLNTDLTDFEPNPGNGAVGTPNGFATATTNLEFNVTVNPVTANFGNFNLDIIASGHGIVDLAGNAFLGTVTLDDQYMVDNIAPALSPDQMVFKDNGLSPETITFNLSEELNTAAGSLLGFSTSAGLPTFGSAVYSSKGINNTITLTSALNGQWTNSITVSYVQATGAYVDLRGLFLADITAHSVIELVVSLGAGDIAFTSFNSDADQFSIVLLRNLAAGAQIVFTDKGWNSSTSSFRTEANDGLFTWTTPISYSAGSEFKFTSTGDGSGNDFSVSPGSGVSNDASKLKMNTAGDEILAYQTDGTIITFLGAVKYGHGEDWEGDGIPDNDKESALPTGLLSTHYLLAGDIDDGAYRRTGTATSFTGSTTELRALFSSTSNWSLAADDPATVDLPGDTAPAVWTSFTGGLNYVIRPKINSVAIPNTPMKVNDIVIATITVDDDAGLIPATLTSGTVAGFTITPASLVRTSPTTYTATFTIPESLIAANVAAASAIPIASLVLTNSLGNPNNPAFTAANVTGLANNDAIDANSPILTSIVRASGTNAWSSTNGTSASTVDYTVTFDQVINRATLTAADFFIPLTGSLAGATISNITPAGNTNIYTVTVTTNAGLTLNGTLGLNYIDDNVNDVQDPSGNKTKLNNGNANGSVTGPTYTIVLPQPSNPVQSFTLTPQFEYRISSVVTHDIVGPNLPTHYLVMVRETLGAAFPSVTDGTPIIDDLYDGTYDGCCVLFTFNLGDGVYIRNVTKSGLSNTVNFDFMRSGVNYQAIVYPYTKSANYTDDNIDYGSPTTMSTILPVATNSALTATASSTTVSSTIVSAPSAQNVFTFTLRDGDGIQAGGGQGYEYAPTRFDGVTINQNAALDNVPDWGAILAGAELYDINSPTTFEVAASITSNQIIFNTIPSTIISDLGYIAPTVSYNSIINSKQYGLRVYFKSTTGALNNHDNLVMSFTVNNSDFTYNDGAGTLADHFQSTRIQAGSATSGSNTIDIYATKLVFMTNPQTTIGVGINFNQSTNPQPRIEARDANDNLDVNYAATFNVTLSPTTGHSTTLTNFGGGVLTLSTFNFTTAGARTIMISGNATGAPFNYPALTGVTSSSVNAVLTNLTTITPGASGEPAIISSLGTALGAATAPQTTAVQNFDFIITDDNGANGTTFADNDALPTRFIQLVISQGTGNDPILANWTDAIASAELQSGPGIASGTIGSNSITFGPTLPNAVTGDLGFVGDGPANAKTYRLRIALKTGVTIPDVLDNKDFVFRITTGDITPLATPNSTSAIQASQSTDSGDGNNTVIVTATQLDYVLQPAAIQSYDSDITPPAQLKARDVNGNLDRNFSFAVTDITTGFDFFPVDGRTYPVSNGTGMSFLTGQLTLNSNLKVSSTGNGLHNDQTQLTVISNGLTRNSNTITLNYSNLSDIVKDPSFTSGNTYASGNGYPENILYKDYQGSTFTTNADGIALERFLLQDGGGSSDADGTATKLQTITLNISNYQYLRTVAIYDGSTKLAERAVAGNITNISGVTGDLNFPALAAFQATDNANNDFTIYATFNQTGIIDNSVVQVRVKGATLNPVGSFFTTGGDVTTFAPLNAGQNENRIEVVAVQIDFTTQPIGASISVPLIPTIIVSARDAFMNLDADYNGTISATGTTTPISVPTNPPFTTINNPAITSPTGDFSGGQFTYNPIFQFIAGDRYIRLTINAGVSSAGGGNIETGTLSGVSSDIDVISSFESQLISDNSIINAGAGLTQDIDFINYQATDIIATSATTTNGFTLDLLNLFDGGSDMIDLDGAPTVLDDLTLGISNPQSIRRIAIYTKDISGNVTEVQDFLITDGALSPSIVNGYGTITFTNLNITAADNARNQILVLATFRDTPATIKDRDDIKLAVLGATLNTGSKFAPDAAQTGTIAGVVTSSFTFPEATASATVGTKGYLNKLQVTATSLDFEDDTFTLTPASALAGKQEPIDGSAGASPGGNTGIVYARDKFGIIDTDFNSVAIVSAPAQPISYPNLFINGKLDLVGMQYQNAGVGTLNVTATGSNSILLNSDIAGAGNIGNSTPSITVDVIHVTAIDDLNTVELQTSLKGGTTNKRIFGVNFSAEHSTTTQPTLSGFSFQFRDDAGNAYPYTKSATDNIFKNFKLFVAEGTGAPTALSEGIDYTLTPGQTVALSSTNPPADYKDKLTFVLTNPVPLYQTNYKFYLNVDIDVNVSVGTAPITPYLIDLGYYGPNTNGHIVTSVGSSSTITDDATPDVVKGITRKFASTKPPVLVSTTPSSGTLNVDPDLNTITLKFDVPVVTFDGVINVYNRTTGTLRAIFTSTNGKYVDGVALKDQVVPTLDFAAPVGFNFKADTVYYVTVEKGVFSNTDVTQRKGISDEGFNLYGGISYSGTFYFKGSSIEAPILSGTDATKYYFTPTTATFNFKFNQPGKVHYMVVHPTLPAAAPPTVTNDQILNNTPYTTSTVIARGTTTIDQLSPNLQFATINTNLTNDVDYYVYAFAENNAQPLPIATLSPYGSSANSFAVGTAGPTLKIKKTGSNTSPYSNPRFEICPNSSVKMEEPIIISEAAGNNSDFSTGFTGGAIQTFNILLPTGFQYDVTKNPTISFNGADFGSLPSGPVLRFRSSTLLEINFVNTGIASSDNIIISNLYLLSSAADIGGNIVRFGGTGLTTVADDRVLARITSGVATSIPFTSSYDKAFSPWPYSQIASALPYKPVTYIPDNFASIVKLIPAPPVGDYGSSFFAGSGLTNDELTLSAVTLNASFNITLTHTDQNGCATTTVEQYQVYDHASAIPELLEVQNPGVSYNIDKTKIGLIPGAPDPVTNIPGLPTPTFNVNDLVSHLGLAGYQLIDLYADIPLRVKNLTTDPLKGQVLDYATPGWQSLVNSIRILNTSYPDANLGQTFKSFNWEYSKLINKTSTTAAGVQYPYDPTGRFARIIQSSGTGNGRTFFEAGSLGIIEFTGVYQSTADFSVFIPFRQEIELFIPAVPIVEVSGQSSKAGETSIFCESGLPFTVIGYPLANSSDVKGFFTLRDSVNKNVIVDPGFVDNANGTATFDPTKIILKNGYKTIKIEYTFQQNNSPAVGTGAYYIRVTPNPVANFITSTLCEDIDVVFTDTTLDPIPGDVRISEWLWSFGDASSAQNSDIIKNPKHVYPATGLYANVNLRVKTNYACASVIPKSVDLEIGGTPTVDFLFDGVSTADPINFTNTSIVSPNDGFKQLDWTFGDATTQVITSGFVTTSHNYTLPKFYDVNLKVTSTIGCFNDSTKRIVVLSRAIPTTSAPYSENFETINGMWQASSLPTRSYGINPSSWVVGTPTTSVIKITDPATFGSKVVKTNLSGTYNPLERSAWYSPSFDISQLERPMVSFNSFTQMEISDGVVLQYSTDNKNVADPSKVWWALGQQGEGVDWFTAQGITAKPGNQPDKDYGWSTIEKNKWVESKHALDNVTGKDPIVKVSRVVFRFALASAKSSIVPDGFALDNFRLGERTRTILLENFTSSNGKDAAQNATVKSENEFVSAFVPGGLGTTVVKLNYHIGFTGTDPFNLDNPADPSARALYYNVKNVPYAFLDGSRSIDAISNPAFSSWGQKAYDTQTLQLGQADITVPAPIVGADGSIKFNVQVKALYNLPDTTVLHVAIIEQSIIASSLAQAQKDQIKTGETTLDFVLKKMLPNASGTKFGTPLAKDQSRTFTGFEYYPDPSKLYTNKDDLAIIVFLQNENRKELKQNIYQTELITGILDPPVVTGLENSELLANMEVYPNPANNEFTIQLPGDAKQTLELQLVDQVGKVVTKDSIKEGTSRKTINSQDLAAGIYILQIGSGKSGVVRKKILVVHQD